MNVPIQMASVLVVELRALRLSTLEWLVVLFGFDYRKMKQRRCMKINLDVRAKENKKYGNTGQRK